MGGPMAGHLAKAGHTVTVYNRTTSKSDRWAQQHQECDVHVAATPAAAAKNAEFIFSCVGNDDDLRQVTVGPKAPSSSTTPRHQQKSPVSLGRPRKIAASCFLMHLFQAESSAPSTVF
jgi:3-hydroxyisobutyrate dehydrogenase-like beta-hydroxyacid dehydrogenase